MPSKSVAIVTGASQGIGRATAIRLARDFEAVVLAARQEDELKKTAADSKIRGRRTSDLRARFARSLARSRPSSRARSTALAESTLC